MDRLDKAHNLLEIVVGNEVFQAVEIYQTAGIAAEEAGYPESDLLQVVRIEALRLAGLREPVDLSRQLAEYRPGPGRGGAGYHHQGDPALSGQLAHELL